MIDVNGLKLVNDTYGHLVGDQMLREATAIVRECCRKEDIIGRWGGDEFVILLPRTDIQAAQGLGQRIMNACKDVRVKDVPLSLSLGVACRGKEEKELGEVLVEAEDNMYRHKLTESRSARSVTLQALLRTLAAKSFETEAHTLRMQKIAEKIGIKLALPVSELKRLELLITLHDIGKINISEEILTKKEPLTSQEWKVIKKHPETGFRVVRAMPEFAHVAEDILAHHERWDGTGYPRGLKGKDIPLLARITAVADAYEVMSNGRPYKEPLQKKDIVEEFKRCAGTQFDPELIQVLDDSWEELD